MSDLNTLDDLKRRLRKNPEYRKLERLRRPFHQLVVQIIRRRNALGMTQKDLAEKAGTYQSRISKIEMGEHDIRLSTLTQIAEALQSKVSITLEPFSASDYADVDREYIEFFTSGAKLRGNETNYVVPSRSHSFNVIKE